MYLLTRPEEKLCGPVRFSDGTWGDYYNSVEIISIAHITVDFTYVRNDGLVHDGYHVANTKELLKLIADKKPHVSSVFYVTFDKFSLRDVHVSRIYRAPNTDKTESYLIVGSDGEVYDTNLSAADKDLLSGCEIVYEN